MENYFLKFKKKTIGDMYLPQLNKKGKKIIYADWAASGRLYMDIEREILLKYGPIYSNTHSEDTFMGKAITEEYINAKEIIKHHFNAGEKYAVISTGHGMTAAINKFQDIILNKDSENSFNDKHVVFITHYEHNSNYISWVEKGVECVILDFDDNGDIDLDVFDDLLMKYKGRKIIGSFSACSNVTGVRVDIKTLARKIKEFGGIVCIDYTTIAPYDVVNLKESNIDALVFSSHKLLGGVGGTGILLMKKSLYKRTKPTVMGGGVVHWVNNWGDIIYLEDIEKREEAGTPPILQTIRTALALKLKENMGVRNIAKREQEINKRLFSEFENISNLEVYDVNLKNRISIISFNIQNAMYKKIVSELDESYGVQTRGGCCCAPIYGHRLLGINKEQSKRFASRLQHDKENKKLGWVRVSLNPIISDKELDIICGSIREIAYRYKCLEFKTI